MSYGSVFAPGLFAGKIEKLQKVADEITEDGGAVSFHVGDIRREDAARKMPPRP
jgi:hypothetical protein